MQIYYGCCYRSLKKFALRGHYYPFYSFNKYLLSIYYVSSNFLDVGKRAVNKANKIPALMGFSVQERKMGDKCNK